MTDDRGFYGDGRAFMERLLRSLPPPLFDPKLYRSNKFLRYIAVVKGRSIEDLEDLRDLNTAHDYSAIAMERGQ